MHWSRTLSPRESLTEWFKGFGGKSGVSSHNTIKKYSATSYTTPRIFSRGKGQRHRYHLETCSPRPEHDSALPWQALITRCLCPRYPSLLTQLSPTSKEASLHGEFLTKYVEHERFKPTSWAEIQLYNSKSNAPHDVEQRRLEASPKLGVLNTNFSRIRVIRSAPELFTLSSQFKPNFSKRRNPRGVLTKSLLIFAIPLVAVAQNPNSAVRVLTFSCGTAAGGAGYAVLRIQGDSGISVPQQALLYAGSALTVLLYGALLCWRWLYPKERIPFIVIWCLTSGGMSALLNNNTSPFTSDSSGWSDSLPLMTALGTFMAHLMIIVVRGGDEPEQRTVAVEPENAIALQEM